MTVKISMESVGKVYGSGESSVVALEEISFDVQQGEFVCFVGPSGCGKSSLIRILAELEEMSSGSVTVNHHDAQAPWNSMVFQQESLLPWMTVEANVGYGLRMRGVDGAVIRTAVDSLLDVTGLDAFRKSFPHQLSGGMQQRAAVARAFANDPEVLLMDEPFGKLDEQNKILLQEETLRIWRNSGKTVLFITHSIDEAIIMADRVVVMTARPGRIKAVIPIDLPRPRSAYELKGTPEFAALVATIWDLLRDEVATASDPRNVAEGAAR